MMKAKVDCISCVFNQALRTAKASGADDETIKQILFESSKLIYKINLDLTPPEIVIPFYETVEKVTRNSDPSKKAKIEHINKALSIYHRIHELVRKTKDPLKDAVRLSIIGNSPDPGSTKDSIDIEQEFSASPISEFFK
jgi:uncharacterized protein with ATP-grasp and redox domains